MEQTSYKELTAGEDANSNRIKYGLGKEEERKKHLRIDSA